jgi:hypothetical protein
LPVVLSGGRRFGHLRLRLRSKRREQESDGETSDR